MSNAQQFRRNHATSRANAANRRLRLIEEVQPILAAQKRSIRALAREMGVSGEFVRNCLYGYYPWPEERIAQLNQILGTDFSLPDDVLSA